MEYIDKLNRLRYEKGLSFRQLGLDCNLSESAVKKIFYKKCDPRISSIEQICTVLGTSLSDLFTITNKSNLNVDNSFIVSCTPLLADTKSYIITICK